MPDPVAGPGEVVVDVERCGVCGTDAEFFTGEMAYLHTGEAAYPIRIGHEWCRRGQRRRVRCGRCVAGPAGHRRHDARLRALRALRRRPPAPVRGPARDRHPAAAGRARSRRGCRCRCGRCTSCRWTTRAGRARRAGRERGARGPGGGCPADRLLVIGPGTIGLLCALIAAAGGAEVHLLGVTPESLEFARSLGFPAWTAADAAGPAVRGGDRRVERAVVAGAGGGARGAGWAGGVHRHRGGGEPARHPRPWSSADLTATGVLSASGGLQGAIERYASGAVDPRPLVAATVGLDEVADVLAGWRRPEWGAAPKIHVDPRR